MERNLHTTAGRALGALIVSKLETEKKRRRKGWANIEMIPSLAGPGLVVRSGEEMRCLDVSSGGQC